MVCKTQNLQQIHIGKIFSVDVTSWLRCLLGVTEGHCVKLYIFRSTSLSRPNKAGSMAVRPSVCPSIKMI